MSDKNIPDVKFTKAPSEENATQTEENTKNTDDSRLTTEVEEKPSTTEPTPTATLLTVNNNAQQQTPNVSLAHLPEKIRILKEAFPDTEIEVIEAVLQTQNDNVESTFELLLSMSDTNYKPENITNTTATTTTTIENDDSNTPTMPPRPAQPGTDNSGYPPYTYWQRQEPRTVEEQLRMDEELAKKIAMEDELRAERRRQRHLQQHQQTRQRPQPDEDDDSLFNLQDELPIIKEKVIEAGNAAKKKVMEFFNQIKANTQKAGNSSTPSMNSQQSHINARYRGLPSNDDGDDLLTSDISALHLSDYDVYAKTGGRLNSNTTTGLNTAAPQDGVIHVNPPSSAPSSKVETSTSDAQLKADEDFARQLAAEEEQRATRRRSHLSSTQNTSSANTNSPPQMPLRKVASPTVVIAPKSTLELDSDYEDVRLTAAPSAMPAKSVAEDNTSFSAANTTVPYVIGDDDDDDDDDSDNLVNIQDDKGKESESVKKVGDDATNKDKKEDLNTKY